MFSIARSLLLTCACLSVHSVDLIFGSPTPTNLTLELVQVLFRHGARAPIECEAKLISNGNDSQYEPWGYAQLTNEGMLQEYKIGEMLRERYGGRFLPELYKPEHVYAYASGLSRTKASLQLVLASLYAPAEQLTWNRNLRWMPTLVHFNPRPLDILVKSRDCPRYEQLVRELYESSEVKERAKEHDAIVKLLEKVYGRSLGFEDFFCAYNGVVVHKSMKLPLPNWYSGDVFEKLKKAAEFHLDNLSYTETLKRLNGGTLVRRLVENVDKHNAGLNRRLIYLYSAHDKTLHAYARSHNLTLPRIPDYGSAIILEKFRDERNNVYVKLLSWSGYPKKLTNLKLDACDEICPYEEYLKIVKPSIPSDEEMRCLFQNLKPEDIEKILDTDRINIS